MARKKKNQTVGEAIDELVEKYGGYTIGIYVLERALSKAIMREGQVTVDGTPVHSTDQYIMLDEKEKKFLAECRRDLAEIKAAEAFREKEKKSS